MRCLIVGKHNTIPQIVTIVSWCKKLWHIQTNKIQVQCGPYQKQVGSNNSTCREKQHELPIYKAIYKGYKL